MQDRAVVLAVTLEDEDGVGRTRDAVGARDGVQEVGGLLLAGVVHHDHRGARGAVDQPLEVAGHPVVALVGRLVGHGGRHDLAERVEHHDRVAVGVQLDELLDGGVQARRRLGGEEQLGRAAGDPEGAHAGLEPLGAVLQRQVQHRSLLDFDGTEGELAAGDGQTEPETQPALADLRCGDEEAQPFGDQSVDHVLHGREHLVQEPVGGHEAVEDARCVAVHVGLEVGHHGGH